MSHEIYRCWEWQLEHQPNELWARIADTDRFNRDTLLPAVEQLPPSRANELENGRRRLTFDIPLIKIVWDEEPFEWVYPYYFSVVRNYHNGPLVQMRVHVQLREVEGGGTHLKYETWVTPRSIIGRLGWPIVAAVSQRRFGEVFKRYDEMADEPDTAAAPPANVKFSPGGQTRLKQGIEQLRQDGLSSPVLDRLQNLLLTGDANDLAQMRPYAYADKWGLARREVLNTFLLSTRSGLLELQWDVMCPHCRGAMGSHAHLSEIPLKSSCDVCHIDFDVNFNRYVEITFSPNNSIRPVEHMYYCMAGPEMTPHIAIQQLVPPNAARSVMSRLEEGRYRLRAIELPGSQPVLINGDGPSSLELGMRGKEWPTYEAVSGPEANLVLNNTSEQEQLFILEHLAWGDDAVTAAEISTMQQFRDLFADEALRAGDQFSVGSLALLFTDIKGSTQLYNEVGDAVAFGLVLEHFDVVKAAILEEEGAIVKTIGDAVMAVFLHPAAGIRAMLKAQERLSMPPYGKRPITLKAALHYGPCIAVSLNERLDYFGSTVNMAARLEKYSQGNDVIISQAVHDDPIVSKLLHERAADFDLDHFCEPIRGFDGEFQLWRVKKKDKS